MTCACAHDMLRHNGDSCHDCACRHFRPVERTIRLDVDGVDTPTTFVDVDAAKRAAKRLCKAGARRVALMTFARDGSPWHDVPVALYFGAQSK